MSEVTKHQVQGKCEAVVLRGDWMEFHIDVGRNYPVKLATKQPDIQEKARAAGDNVAVWSYGETQGNPNPHKPGEFFKNRYLDEVEVGGTLDPALASGQQQLPGVDGAPAQQGGRGGQGATDRSIERQVIVKEVLPHYDKFKSVPEMLAVMDILDNWMGRERGGGIEAPVPESVPVAVAEQQAAAAPGDDDIPF